MKALSQARPNRRHLGRPSLQLVHYCAVDCAFSRAALSCGRATVEHHRGMDGRGGHEPVILRNSPAP